MQTRSMKRKISERQVSQIKKPQLGEVDLISHVKRETRRMKPKISNKKQVSRTEKPKVEQVFPVYFFANKY